MKELGHPSYQDISYVSEEDFLEKLKEQIFQKEDDKSSNNEIISSDDEDTTESEKDLEESIKRYEYHKKEVGGNKSEDTDDFDK